jgi:hypothetical protein
MPLAFKQIALRSEMTDNSAYFMRRESQVDRDREVMQPKFGFAASGPNMNMRRFAAFIGIKECAIGPPA